MEQHGFVRGAMLLAGAAMLTKLLGSVYTIVLQNVIGDQGMGLFQMAYPVYATLLAVATAGFPVAISKLVSERIALGDDAGVRQTFRVAATILTAAGVLAFAVLFLWADTWARIAGDPQAAWAIRAIAPALLLVPFMSALRGYFQGYQWMEPTATSQVLEQLVRVATILGLSVWFMNHGFGSDKAAAGAAFGAVTGAVAGMAWLSYTWFVKHPARQRSKPVSVLTSSQLGKRLLYYAFPISLGALVVPLMNNVDVVTVVNLLKQSGESQAVATTHFGLLTGRAFKLMMLPTTLASGIGIAAMPAVSEAFTLGFRRLMQSRMDTAIRLTVLLSLPAAVGLMLLAGAVDVALFQDTQGTTVIQIMAVATVFASVQTTLAAVLQGVGWVYTPVVNLLIASLCKLIGNLMFVPTYGIRGAAAVTVVSYAVATELNVWAVARCTGAGVRWHAWFVRPALATLVMGGFVYGMYRQWVFWGGFAGTRLTIALSAAVMIGLGIILYGMALIVSGGMSPDELRSVPRIGPRLVSWCTKLGLLR